MELGNGRVHMVNRDLMQQMRRVISGNSESHRSRERQRGKRLT